MEVVLVGSNLMGDTLLQTPGIRKYKELFPSTKVVYKTNTDRESYRLFDNNPYIDEVILLDSLDNVDGIRMDAGVAYGIARSTNKTLAQGFAALLGVDTEDLRYDYVFGEGELERGKELAEEMGNGKPLVAIARHSASCTSNDPSIRAPNKCIPNAIWIQVANWLSKNGCTPVALGSTSEIDDPKYVEFPGPKMYGSPIRDVAALLANCKMVLAVDTGIRHLGAAVGTDTYCISCCIGPELIRCVPSRDGQKIVEDFIPIPLANASLITRAIKSII